MKLVSKQLQPSLVHKSLKPKKDQYEWSQLQICKANKKEDVFLCEIIAGHKWLQDKAYMNCSPLWSLKIGCWSTTHEFSHRSRTLKRVLWLALDSMQWPGSVSLPDKLLSPPTKTSTKWRMLTVSVIRHWRWLHLYLPTFSSFLEDYFNSLLIKVN